MLLPGLQEGFAQYGLAWDEQMEHRFCQFTQELLETNKVMNLTAITEPQEIVTKHYLDSVFPLTQPYLGMGCCVIDVGCGAGFPSIPMKIARPDIQLTLLDALQKRLTFLQRVVQQMALQQVQCIHARAEEGAHKRELREQYDVAVSRAVANLQVLTELCCGYIRQGGYFLALKGPNAGQEVQQAGAAIAAMGCQLEGVIAAPVPGTDMEHTLVVIRKVKKTPPQYPRNYGRISKKPL